MADEILFIIGVPSTTKSGSEEPENDLFPLIFIVEDDPTCPEEEITWAPAILPDHADTTVFVFVSAISSPLTSCTE